MANSLQDLLSNLEDEIQDPDEGTLHSKLYPCHMIILHTWSLQQI